MRSLASRTIVVLVAAFCLSETSAAQSATAASLPSLPGTDSIFRRARRLVSDGNGTSGRALVDSMLRASVEGSSGYGDALFWRGALAETAADAERDYRKVVVEYPLSPYVDDALLSLAELEQARGDRTAAFQHLQRFVREHPASPARARAGLAAARLAFEQRDAARGCAMIADARSSAGTGDVELRNQIDYYGARCPTTSVAATPATPAAPATSATAPMATTSTVAGATTKHGTTSVASSATIPAGASTRVAPAGAPTRTATSIQRTALRHEFDANADAKD